jgi:hypothetical protein
VRETSDGNKNGKSGRSVWKIRLCDKQAALFALLDFLHPLSPPKPGSAQVIGNNAAIDAARALAELRAALRD